MKNTTEIPHLTNLDHKWWQRAVIYQIYPRSFADGNNDGIGDFAGMISKLDYLVDLGIDAVWLSPHYPSPNFDCGYDISDYCAVAPEYGTMADFNLFLSGAHQRNMKVILDLVLNHTSDQHAWFLESRSSRDNPKADWYIWKDSPPNNWQSCFDGSAWTYCEERKQYYYHYFMRQQPDLNWHNYEVKSAMWQVVRFWLNKGVDGFRLDAIGTIFEDEKLTPHKAPLDLATLRRASELAETPSEKRKVEKYWFEMFKNQYGQPGLHELMKELRKVIDEYPGDRVLIAEDEDPAYMGNGKDELHLVFNFPLLFGEKKLTPAWIRKNQQDRSTCLLKISPNAWPCNTLGNHDRSRVKTRFGDGNHDDEYARLSLALMLTLKGTPVLYNGEEIGMTDLECDNPDKLRDTMAIWHYQNLKEIHKLSKHEAGLYAWKMSRDKNRTPMQWSPNGHAGFCTSEVVPWLPVNPNYRSGVNIQDQVDDPNSLYNFYRKMLSIRKSHPALIDGEQYFISKSSKVLAFLRVVNHQQILVILNYSEHAVKTKFDISVGTAYQEIFPITDSKISGELSGYLKLTPFEIKLLDICPTKKK